MKGSIPVVRDSGMDGQQVMNTNFDAFKIVNTYGAFGTITKTRTEVILEGTRAQNPSDPKAKWLEYQFKVTWT